MDGLDWPIRRAERTYGRTDGFKVFDLTCHFHSFFSGSLLIQQPKKKEGRVFSVCLIEEWNEEAISISKNLIPHA
jgi:hypothetical protein